MTEGVAKRNPNHSDDQGKWSEVRYSPWSEDKGQGGAGQEQRQEQGQGRAGQGEARGGITRRRIGVE